MKIKPLHLAVAGVLGYFGLYRPYQERKRAAKALANQTPSGALPRIVFGENCTWTIPNAWWTDVAVPRFQAIIEANTPGLTGEAAVAAVGQLNSHDVTHAILLGELGAGCNAPGSLTATANTPAEQNILNLFSLVLNRVQGGLIAYNQSGGTQVELLPS